MQNLVREATISARQQGEKVLRAGHVRKVREVYSSYVSETRHQAWEGESDDVLIASAAQVQGMRPTTLHEVSSPSITCSVLWTARLTAGLLTEARDNGQI